MKKNILIAVMIFVSLAICGAWVLLESKESRKPKEALAAEKFIQKYLMKEDGRMQTDLLDQKDTYLSETVGLWMDYLLEKNDYAQFHDTVDMLRNYFFTEDYLIYSQ